MDYQNIFANYKDVDLAYRNIAIKSDEVKLAWKILRDKYYSEVYRKLYSEIQELATFIPNYDGYKGS